jgi:hypothetical protein
MLMYLLLHVCIHHGHLIQIMIGNRRALDQLMVYGIGMKKCYPGLSAQQFNQIKQERHGN